MSHIPPLGEPYGEQVQRSQQQLARITITLQVAALLLLAGLAALGWHQAWVNGEQVHEHRVNSATDHVLQCEDLRDLLEEVTGVRPQAKCPKVPVDIADDVRERTEERSP